MLANPNLDLTPVGTLWVQTLCNVMYPPITADALPAYPPDTAPFQAWLGGLVSCVDGIEQTVTVPAGTTQLVLRGRRLTITNETFPQVYDSAFVELTTTAGTVIENALTVTNLTPNTAWATFSKTFAVPHAGETVKLRIRSTNDISNETNFFFDTLALDATVTCP